MAGPHRQRGLQAAEVTVPGTAPHNAERAPRKDGKEVRMSAILPSRMSVSLPSIPVVHSEENMLGAVQGTKIRRNATAEGSLCLKGNLVPVHPEWGTWGSVGRIARFLGTWPAELLWWLGAPGKWLKQAVRLITFVVLMLPGFVPPFLSYLVSKKVVKNIAYGPSFRHQLDLYLPCNTVSSEEEDGQEKKAPVVIFISGGAWVIGYKMWAFIMGQLFQQFGVLFIAPDYRNFPETTVGGMVDDVIHAVGWVFDNIKGLKGDPNNITLMGQSAGAHLSALAVVEQATRGARERGTLSDCGASSEGQTAKPQWQVQDLKRWVGISGPYDIMEYLPQIRKAGLPKRIVSSLMEEDFARFSPVRRIRDLSVADPCGALTSFPPAYLYHGTADKSVVWTQSEAYAEALRKANVEVQAKYYEGKSHTDPILEDPCEGDSDELMTDLLQLLSPGNSGEDAQLWRLQPKLLLRWAKFCNPF